MREEKTLIALLRRVIDLIAEESGRNPDFATRLASALDRSRPSHPRKERRAAKEREPAPDAHREWTTRGETEFRWWLREQPVAAIRAIIRSQDMDPTRRTAKWKEPAKLADFVTDAMRARAARGSAFIDRR